MRSTGGGRQDVTIHKWVQSADDAVGAVDAYLRLVERCVLGDRQVVSVLSPSDVMCLIGVIRVYLRSDTPSTQLDASSFQLCQSVIQARDMTQVPVTDL